MFRVGTYEFKRAETPQEFEQIHCLNFRTFVDEIPQHPDPGDGRLIDKFHRKNAYFIVVHQGRVVGMVSGHEQPPFSVADRLADTSLLKAPNIRPLEVRLLAIEPDKRNSTLFFGLMWSLYEHAVAQGHTHLFISGLKERVDLYRRLGFEALGPAVSCGNAAFVPMVLKVGNLPKRVERVKQLWETHVERSATARPNLVCLLPGPVTMSPRVNAAFHQPPIYHRGPEFIGLFQQVRQRLGALVGGREVALLNGSGTLGNEAVAAVLAVDQSAFGGVMLVNGEFGQRLAQQATRFGLRPHVLTWAWGQPWNLDEVEAALASEPAGSWVWGVHLESSTGVLNDLPGLVEVARRHEVRVCMDCISSLGAVPIDLEGVFLATGASGKSLGSYAGAAIIFANGQELRQLDMSHVPSYFDIGAALANEGPRFTFPSPLLRALDAALADYDSPMKTQLRYEGYTALGQFVRQQLLSLNIHPLAAEECACPVVTTFAPPLGESSPDFVARCRSWGFEVGGQSGYLAERRLVQIATMGAVERKDCEPLFNHLAAWLAPQPALVSR